MYLIWSRYQTCRGILTLTPEQLDEALDNAAEAGLRTETHCIGDAALDMILGALERRLAKGGQNRSQNLFQSIILFYL